MLFAMLHSSLTFEFTRDTNLLLLIQLIYTTNNKLIIHATDNIDITLYKKIKSFFVFQYICTIHKTFH